MIIYINTAWSLPVSRFGSFLPTKSENRIVCLMGWEGNCVFGSLSIKSGVWIQTSWTNWRQQSMEKRPESTNQTLLSEQLNIPNPFSDQCTEIGTTWLLFATTLDFAPLDCHLCLLTGRFSRCYSNLLLIEKVSYIWKFQSWHSCLTATRILTYFGLKYGVSNDDWSHY